jgi:hypothetical protein
MGSSLGGKSCLGALRVKVSAQRSGRKGQGGPAGVAIVCRFRHDNYRTNIIGTLPIGQAYPQR